MLKPLLFVLYCLIAFPSCQCGSTPPPPPRPCPASSGFHHRDQLSGLNFYHCPIYVSRQNNCLIRCCCWLWRETNQDYKFKLQIYFKERTIEQIIIHCKSCLPGFNLRCSFVSVSAKKRNFAAQSWQNRRPV